MLDCVRMNKRPNLKPGRTIIPYGVFPELHELETAAVFLAQGKDVEFIAPVVLKVLKHRM